MKGDQLRRAGGADGEERRTDGSSGHDKARILIDVVRQEGADVESVAGSAQAEGETSAETVANGAREEAGGGKGRVLSSRHVSVSLEGLGML